ncbi:MAG: hypothetical protein K1X88_01175 [Nannocystaceae bacterium]|nr:hypothetical protein [Nannocystaceae bacterium]
MARRAAIVVGVLALGGCGKSDADGEGSSSTGATVSSSGDATTTTSGTTGTTGSADGSSSSDGGVRYDLGGGDGSRYLLALSTPLDPTLPLQFIAELTVTDGVLAVSLQPLSLDPGSTDAPRDPVGPLLQGGVDFMTPAFSAAFDPFALPAEADPVAGMARSGMLTLVGSLAGAGAPCGSGMGVITSPSEVDLDGSTWGTVPLGPGDALPDTIATACP